MERSLEDKIHKEGTPIIGKTKSYWPRVFLFESKYYYSIAVSSSIVTLGFMFEIPESLVSKLKNSLFLYSEFSSVSHTKLQTFGPGHPNPRNVEQDEFSIFVKDYMYGNCQSSFESTVCSILWGHPDINKNKIDELEFFLTKYVKFTQTNRPYYNFSYNKPQNKEKTKKIILSYIDMKFQNWTVSSS